ncbi:Y4yA family PLP-dependent enzyme [Rosistilla oblonga]|uniref:Y4yA family PLP-dependent enzyme n=1 Tax=Rosistilla oblonga TaxID=2527990 RepID=UPI003A96EAA0
MTCSIETSDTTDRQRIATLRSFCQGTPPLDAVLEPWVVELLSDRRPELDAACERFGSPLNVISAEPMVRNIEQLNRVADERELHFQVYFARKANKCLAFVDAANRIGAGIDVASEAECKQAIDRGVRSADILCTAAIKPQSLIRLCVQNRVPIAIDNIDELRCVEAVAAELAIEAEVAIRISGFEHEGEKLFSRFGFDIDEAGHLLRQIPDPSDEASVRVCGIHFHLDGYSAAQRISAIRQSLPLIDRFRSLGHDVRFLDIGGGLPMCYLESESQWDAFHAAHRSALLGERKPITFKNDGLGFINVDGKLHGRRNTYPYYQSPSAAAWLAGVLDAEFEPGETLAAAIRQRQLQLRCEPGRSALNGCGITVARVEFVKRHPSGDSFVGVAMNRTQCRTGSDDFLVDPLVLQTNESASLDRNEALAGYFVGAYCTESELISLRRFRFPQGIAAGDLVVLPNTAGYFMHFLESRSHQFPLATNVVVDRNGEELFRVDAIDS